MAEETLQSATRTRGTLKAQLTRFASYLDTYHENPSIEQLKQRISKASELWDAFGAVQAKIEALTEEQDHERDRASFEDAYFNTLARAQRLLEGTNGLESEGTVSTTTSQQPKVHVKLPTINLPKFSGNYESWLCFYDNFKSLIHDNDNVNPIQKFHYLRSCLTNDAAQIVQSLETTERNYEVAWSLLKEQYDNRRVIIQGHIRSLFEIQSISKESSSQLSQLINNFMKHVHALKALELPTDHWDAMLLHLITSKLDRRTHREWELSLDGSDMPLFDDLLKFLRNRCHTLDNIVQENTSNAKPLTRAQRSATTSHDNKARQAYFVAESKHSCVLCGQPHSLQGCGEFLGLDYGERCSKIRSKGLCFNCLRPGHLVSSCKSGTCRKCNRKHNTLLHPPTLPKPVSPSESVNVTAEANVTTTLQASLTSQILLSTASVHILNSSGEMIACKILLDSGSQSNFMTDRMAEVLNLKKRDVNIPVSGFNQRLTHINHAVEATIQSRDGRYSSRLKFLVVPKISERLPTEFIDRRSLSIPKNVLLADPEFCKPTEIDALVGTETFYHMLCIGQIKVANQTAVLQKTKLGWIISGRINNSKASSTCNASVCNLALDSLESLLHNFWQVEDVPGVKYLSSEESACEAHFVENTRRDNTGRYIVKLPFNERKSEIGESYKIAERRFYAIERKLIRDKSLHREYTNFIEEYARLNHMTEVKNVKHLELGYFMPHHAVVKQSSLTTKLRVVFDASAKSDTGVSLNDALMVGPNLQEDIFSLVTRFRTYTYALTGDIEKMYRQIGLHEDDTKYQRILWRSTQGDPLKTFELNTVTYGTASASFLATRCIRQLALDECESPPAAARVIQRDFYVDDLITGANDMREAMSLRDELISLLQKGRFNLRQWCSNEASLLTSLEDKVNDPHIRLQTDKASKTLGLFWNPRDDTFSYLVKGVEQRPRVTKRMILSRIASLFDPLGLLGPVIVMAKILMQRLWQIRLDWDESVPMETATSWFKYQDDLRNIEKLTFPRRILLNPRDNVQLHGFCDSSELAYGACIYLRSTHGGDVLVRLVCSRSRVAPIKRVSLPRLELCSAFLLTRLYEAVIKALNLEIDEIYLWSDSTIVLRWIQTSTHKLKTFVANRVSQIQTITTRCKWRHVPTECNPADDLSRGQLPSRFVENYLWQFGPDWLRKRQDFWPENITHDGELLEQRTTVALKITELPDVFDKFSSWSTLKRVLAYCLRFYNNISNKGGRRTGRLSTLELSKSVICIVRAVQGAYFPGELLQLCKGKRVEGRSKLKTLNPFVDKQDVIRVGGRLKHAHISDDKKYPMILPKHSHVTKIIIRDAHLRGLHCGVQSTLYHVRELFWPIDAKNCIKGIIRKCVVCLRSKPAIPNYVMGNIPKERLVCSRPFENVGVDYCGPFYIKEKRYRNRGRIKIYVSVFVCLTTKALHLEVVSDLTTEAFIACLKRLFARRGKARVMQSDNATNFLGARNELKELGVLVNSDRHKEQIDKFLVDQGITWKVIPPRSPHFGGIWESAVRSFKYHFNRVIGDTLLSFEDFNTFTIEVEAVLNSRPLTPLSNDPIDLTPLTPAHFLIGSSLQTVPEHDFINIQANRLSSWQLVQRLKQCFWRRWYKEYLNQLQQRVKWFYDSENNINIGTLVLLRDDNLPPLQWRLGRITDVHPGDDNVIRVVSVRTGAGVYKRALKMVIPLPID